MATLRRLQHSRLGFACLVLLVFLSNSTAISLGRTGPARQATSSPARDTYVLIDDSFVPTYGTTKLVTRPLRLEISSADSTVTLRDIIWQQWGSPEVTATASGTTCSEGGSEGYVCDRGRVSIRASNAVHLEGDLYYTRVLATGIPDYGASAVSLPTKRPSPTSLSRDCGFSYHGGHQLGDGEYSGGALMGVINMTCAAAWQLVRSAYPRVLSADNQGATHLAMGSFGCRFELSGPVSEKTCSRGRQRFFFL